MSTYTENLAAGKTTAQSSTYLGEPGGPGGQSGKAVDGDPDTEFDNGHCSHTELNPSPSWWRVDLGSNNVPVYEVHIVNRFSQHEHIRQRSSLYIITLGEFYYYYYYYYYYHYHYHYHYHHYYYYYYYYYYK